MTNTNQTEKKRKRRFGDETERVFLPHMPSNISATTMTDQQQKIYICTNRSKLSEMIFVFFSSIISVQFRIEDLTRRLKQGDYGISTIPEKRYLNNLTIVFSVLLILRFVYRFPFPKVSFEIERVASFFLLIVESRVFRLSYSSN